jgi:hypothetical protein
MATTGLVGDAASPRSGTAIEVPTDVLRLDAEVLARRVKALKSRVISALETAANLADAAGKPGEATLSRAESAREAATGLGCAAPLVREHRSRPALAAVAPFASACVLSSSAFALPKDSEEPRELNPGLPPASIAPPRSDAQYSVRGATLKPKSLGSNATESRHRPPWEAVALPVEPSLLIISDMTPLPRREYGQLAVS